MALALALGSAALLQSATYNVKLTASNRDHGPAVISFRPSEGFPEIGVLRSSEGAEIPFQKLPSGEIVFVSSPLKKGETRLLAVEPGANPPVRAAALRQGDNVQVKLEGRDVFQYKGETEPLPRPDIDPVYKRGGYIHPILSPSGKMITDDYPPNHVHHHGIWSPWTKTTFEGRHPDFWNMKERTGTVVPAGIQGPVWSGPVQAGFVAHHHFVDLTANPPKAALLESWAVTATHIPNANFFLFDLVITQRCATASPLLLPKYFYGGLGVRGNWAWNGTNNCFFLTANGETNRVKGNETAAAWCHMSGMLDGGQTGLAIMCHPDNFRAPQGMRLHPGEPFFCYAPSQGGDWSIEPGRPYVARYRFIVQDGAPNKDELDRLWNDYARPPKAELLRP